MVEAAVRVLAFYCARWHEPRLDKSLSGAKRSGEIPRSSSQRFSPARLLAARPILLQSIWSELTE